MFDNLRLFFRSSDGSPASTKSKSPLSNGETPPQPKSSSSTMVNGVSSKPHGDPESVKDIKNSLAPSATQATPVFLVENVVVS